MQIFKTFKYNLSKTCRENTQHTQDTIIKIKLFFTAHTIKTDTHKLVFSTDINTPNKKDIERMVPIRGRQGGRGIGFRG